MADDEEDAIITTDEDAGAAPAGGGGDGDVMVIGDDDEDEAPHARAMVDPPAASAPVPSPTRAKPAAPLGNARVPPSADRFTAARASERERMAAAAERSPTDNDDDNAEADDQGKEAQRGIAPLAPNAIARKLGNDKKISGGNFSANSNLALNEEGAVVLVASSSDSRYPSSNIIDGDEKTFWMTTGMYPQEVIIQFPKAVKLQRIKTVTKNVLDLAVFRCENSNPLVFDLVYEQELSDRLGARQEDVQTVDGALAVYLKFVIKSGREDFSAVYKVEVEGKSI